MIYVAKLIPYFWLIFANFQSEADCLSINNVTDKDLKWLFFMSWPNSSFLLSNPNHIFKISATIGHFFVAH